MIVTSGLRKSPPNHWIITHQLLDLYPLTIGSSPPNDSITLQPLDYHPPMIRFATLPLFELANESELPNESGLANVSELANDTELANESEIVN